MSDKKYIILKTINHLIFQKLIPFIIDYVLTIMCKIFGSIIFHVIFIFNIIRK